MRCDSPTQLGQGRQITHVHGNHDQARRPLRTSGQEAQAIERRIASASAGGVQSDRVDSAFPFACAQVAMSLSLRGRFAIRSFISLLGIQAVTAAAVTMATPAVRAANARLSAGYPHRFQDERGVEFWSRIMAILETVGATPASLA